MTYINREIDLKISHLTGQIEQYIETYFDETIFQMGNNPSLQDIAELEKKVEKEYKRIDNFKTELAKIDIQSRLQLRVEKLRAERILLAHEGNIINVQSMAAKCLENWNYTFTGRIAIIANYQGEKNPICTIQLLTKDGEKCEFTTRIRTGKSFYDCGASVGNIIRFNGKEDITEHPTYNENGFGSRTERTVKNARNFGIISK